MSIEVHPEVEEALRAGRPVVALESAVITTGLPAEPRPRPPGGDAPGWDPNEPTNFEVARLLERTVREADAVPATVAVVGGALRIGLDEGALRRLATEGIAAKATARDVAYFLTRGGTAGTTVAGTILAARRCPAGAIRVLATGGIGGIHRGWPQRFDVSADLGELAGTAVCVVASGVKSVLDAAATLEALETLGVPVIGFGTDQLPQFYSGGSDELRAPRRLDAPEGIAELCRAHWETLGASGGILVANPPPEPYRLDAAETDRLVVAAETEARRQGITGGRRTPYLLAAVMAGTDRALEANVALLVANARLAAGVAAVLATL